MSNKMRIETPIDKALWFIESHSARDISLDEIAAVAGLSRYQLSRGFSRAVGMPLSSYLRGRRLSEAARALAAGAPDILTIALEAGYGSHEAFARAFQARFGLTPGALRARRNLDELDLVEPLRDAAPPAARLSPPRLQEIGPLTIAGFGRRFPPDGLAGIPALWQLFHDHIGHVRGQLGNVAYGISIGTAGGDGCHYIAGVEVADLSGIPSEFTGIRLPRQLYAVFVHHGHVSRLPATVRAICDDWLPASGTVVGDMPGLIERYDASFDPWTGTGRAEIWLPVRAAADAADQRPAK